MDDLNGLDWSKSNTTANKPSVTGTGNYYTSLRPTPTAASSGRSTPLSAQASGAFKPPTAGVSKPLASDSFANLVSFGSTKSGNTLTLQEQQERLQAEKAKRVAEQKKQHEAQFGHSGFWDGLGAKPQVSSNIPPVTSRTATLASNHVFASYGTLPGSAIDASASSKTEDDDLFAAFNADTKVDNSSHYPPPTDSVNDEYTPIKKRGPDLRKPESWKKSAVTSSLGELGDDDDPFGLGKMAPAKAAPLLGVGTVDDDDDFLGDLAKPVEEIKRQSRKKHPTLKQQDPEDGLSDSDDPWDKAVSELVDMGFSAENSRRALTESGAGLDIQAAVGWLLNDAHRQAKQKAQSKGGQERRIEQVHALNSNGVNSDASAEWSHKEAIPAWMRAEGRNQSRPRRDDSRSPANGDGDISRTAAAVGNNLLKTANSLWKTSQKKVQKAVQELSQDSDLNQPKWMRDGSTERQQPREKQTSSRDLRQFNTEPSTSHSVTDEALMLEADSRPPQRKTKPTADLRFAASGSTSSRDQSPAPSNPSTGRSTPIPRWQQTMPAAQTDPRSRLNKQAVEEQSAQAYVSPARRKKVMVPPQEVKEPDLLFGDVRSGTPQSSNLSQPTKINVTEIKSHALKSSKPTAPIAVRPKALARNIPALSPIALANSTQHRLAGTEQYKRGDYASAHTSYTSSLDSLTKDHPITIILLCNRSLTALKTGDPKGAVSDADAALSLIGPSRGENESIDLGNGVGDGKKPMQEFWGKALIRKAEGLEQMERWQDAGAAWKEAVEAGVGGATAVQGRQRCEKALQPKPKPSTVKQPQRVPPKPKSTLGDLTQHPVQSTAAVNRLRAANVAAEKADDEKFALSDSVNARISKWQDGRKDNLRALLGGLDQVLWQGSGWKKVGMHELVVNGKVKIIYMKAIARVHPDKLPQDANTEVKMISALVFATLNEAWDKFKTENGI